MAEKKIRENTLFTKEMIKTVIIFLAVLIILKFLILEPFLVLGTSMEPNFQNQNYIFVEGLTYLYSSPQRGDVVVFKHPEKQCNDFLNASYINRFLPFSPCTNFIKRIIGLPGETVIIKNGTVTIKNKEHPNGFTLNEPYIPDTANFKLQGDETTTLGKDEYFTLGDNREPNASLDSREWGPLPRDHIIGKAWLRVLPLSEIGLIPEPKY